MALSLLHAFLETDIHFGRWTCLVCAIISFPVNHKTKQVRSKHITNDEMCCFMSPESSVGDEGASIIASALKHNQKLQSLNLDDTGIEYHGANLIASSLHGNVSLRSLSLNFCSVQNVGVSHLMEALKMNSMLETLCIQHVGCTSSVVKCMMDALQVNEALRFLCINGMTLSLAEMRDFQSHLSKKCSVIFVDLFGFL
eukprot:TRINITY_DN5214_c0_g2_i2.p1 TRINITY_DN5214_c0_g2~~TRINITY_DN5214_c0_g2_i2.p1  ORF type:complete len:198 (+),score=49.72 TRINITY_DN5214_c0_g2_i2:416-1009(+)